MPCLECLRLRKTDGVTGRDALGSRRELFQATVYIPAIPLHATKVWPSHPPSSEDILL